jgi:hypothetical protein
MARGWESKSVEMQIEDRERKPASSGPAADPALQREIEVLELSRKRLLFELDSVGDMGDHRFRAVKKRALAHVEAAMAALAAKRQPPPT